MKFPDPNAAYEWAASRCARAEYCRADLARKLADAELAQADIERVLDRLEDEHFIDHERYARAFVHDKFEYSQWGRVKISQALRLKKISRQLIQSALDEVIEPTRYAETLLALLRHKRRSLVYDPTDRKARFAASQKLVRFGGSRGFETDLIFSTIDQLDPL